MIFSTEMEITLPSVKEEDYYSSIQHNVGKFLGKVPKAFAETIEMKYLPGKGHNMISFNWPSSIIGEVTGTDDDLARASKRVSFWFRHCKFFRKHGVRRVFTSYKD